ncbi:hypothetical protein POTOM_052360 [Populus tomentosa]|uniref:peptidylprolyl isomerase n=1 Tax=Populus tomentosa TaxID=118781 RepID=A0A8X8C5S0_POPTO|nr:hypothetical protein POTOM_052360 [Populus tomentosa]
MEHLSLNPSLQNEIENENLGLPEKDIGSQGLRKKIVKKGISWQTTPFPGDEVEVHFSGHIEGGAGHILIQVNGEKASFTIPPNLAYGEASSQLLIPPNATLVFDVEILLKHEAKLENGILVSKSEEGVEFHIGDGYLCPASSKAVKTMSKGEKAELAYFSNKYTCGLYHYRTIFELQNLLAANFRLQNLYSSTTLAPTKLEEVNAKGLFRRSQACLKTSELEKAEAEADIKKAPAIDPNNRYV